MHLTVWQYYQLTAAVSSFAGYVPSSALFLCYIFFSQNDNTVLGLRKVKKSNPL